MKDTIKKSFIGGLVFLLTVIIGGLAYAAVSSSVNSGDTLTASMWNNMNNYSTDEINTGKKWIDGKDIYRKVMTLNIPAGLTDTKHYSFGETLGVDSIVNTEIFFIRDTGLQVDENNYFSQWSGFAPATDAAGWGSSLIVGTAVDGFYFRAAITHALYTNVRFIAEYTKN